jgi:pimeloyl-ACP methyl ester carboxylesterase
MSGRSERIRVPGGDVSLRALHWGEPGRSTLVLLHGGGANAHWWDHVAPALADAFHVVALDFRGHGDSDYPEDVYVGAFSDDLDALLDHLEAADAVLIGHSMGAHIALDRAARVPGARALVLLDLAWGSARGVRRAARRALTMRFTYPDRDAALARFRFLPGNARVDESLRLAIAEQSVRREPDGRWGFQFDPRWFGLPYRKLPPLGQVTCPTLLVRGSESPFLPADAAQALVGELPDARLLELERAGHHLHVERPDAVIEALRAFLQQLP